MSGITGRNSVGSIGGGASIKEKIQEFFKANSTQFTNFPFAFATPIDFTKYRLVEFVINGKLASHGTGSYFGFRLNGNADVQYQNVLCSQSATTERLTSGLVTYWNTDSVHAFPVNSRVFVHGYLSRIFSSNLIQLDMFFAGDGIFGRLVGHHTTITTITELSIQFQGGDPTSMLQNSNAIFYGWLK